MTMPNIKPAPRKLTGMMTARDRTMTALDNIDGQLRRAAEAETRADATLPPSFGRHATNWTRVHEAHYRAVLATITSRRANETGALRAKLMRQCDAIRAEIVRSHRSKPAKRPKSHGPCLARENQRQ